MEYGEELPHTLHTPLNSLPCYPSILACKAARTRWIVGGYKNLPTVGPVIGCPVFYIYPLSSARTSKQYNHLLLLIELYLNLLFAPVYSDQLYYFKMPWVYRKEKTRLNARHEIRFITRETCREVQSE